MAHSRTFVGVVSAALVIGLLLACSALTKPGPASPTPTATGTRSLTPVATLSATAIPPALTRPVATHTATPGIGPLTATPFPAPTPAGPVALAAPLVIDSAGGRIYAAARVGPEGRGRTAVLAAGDGRLLTSYEAAGGLALDAARGWLYVDQGNQGLAILDADTGARLRTVTLPPLPPGSQAAPAPQADPATGRVLAMRGPAVYVIDAERGLVEREIGFDLRAEDNCRIPHDATLPIGGARLDSAGRILYLDFVTYVCTPWIGFTIVAYDLAAGREIGHWGSYPFQAVVSDGALYGASWHRFGIGFLWAWRDGRLAETTDWGGAFAGLQVDAGRGRLYQAVGGSLRVFDTRDMRLLMVVALPRAGQLVGYDPASDQLYFLQEGQLWRWRAADIEPPTPVQLAASPPSDAASMLAVSPDWPRDRTLFGVWGRENSTGDCYVFDQPAGRLYATSDGGGWTELSTGLPPGCAYATALAVSPDYARDRTLLAGIAGAGLFRSIDGGALWQPAGAGLPSMGVRQILFSPGWAADRTAFAVVRTGALQRSTDGGDSWHALPLTPYLAALSPEFPQDHTVVAGAYSGSPQRTALWVSRDGGERWQALGDAPPGDHLLMLSLAPLFGRWQVLFACSSDGTLYRSRDGGQSWQAVLPKALENAAYAQIDYGPQEESRPVFFLAAAPGNQGRLFRSRDGGLTWEQVLLAQDVTPTALALSPDFARDGLILVGTGDGRVLSLAGMSLPAVAP